MAKCKFRYSFPGNPETLVRHIDGAITRAGGAFSGNASEGFFSVPTPVGTIEGNYRIGSQTIDIAVTQKPLFLPCSGIQQKLDEYVRSA